MSVSFEHVRIAQGVEQLHKSEWQNLVYGRPALRLEVLGAIARNATRPLPLQFFLLEDQWGLAAAAIYEPVAAGSVAIFSIAHTEEFSYCLPDPALRSIRPDTAGKGVEHPVG